MDYPNLYSYFYDGRELEDNINPDKKQRLLIMSEMLADMLDHAAASKVVELEEEGWDDYAREMYDTSPVFREFLKNNGDWYPAINKWVKFN